jgi:shikimate dehydrogenase
MHQAALAKAGLIGFYTPFDLTNGDLKASLSSLWQLGFQGLNVTVPLKLLVIPHLNSLSPQALAIGAVNTLVATENGYQGHNTDATGFADAYLTHSGPKALLLGTGGAARAIASAFSQKFSASFICGRDFDKTISVAGHFNLEPLKWSQLSSSGPWDLIVNATSSSTPTELGPDKPLVNAVKGGLVVDINYGRHPNYFENLAAGCGASFSDGLPMLAAQARRSFSLWTNVDPGLEVFLSALSKDN